MLDRTGRAPPNGAIARDRARARAPDRVLELQRSAGNAAVGRLLRALLQRDDELPEPGAGSYAPPTPAQLAQALRKSFAEKFPDAAAMIRDKPSAQSLLEDAGVAGAKFGGFSEDGPVKAAWAYTIGSTVYVPKGRTDKVIAASDFLFELNNAMREPQFGQNYKDAVAKKVDAKTYAHRKIELEVEGMLRLGKIWFEIKNGDKSLDKYDHDWFLGHYLAVKDKKITQAQLVEQVLQWKNGVAKTKTNEQYYMDQVPK